MASDSRSVVMGRIRAAIGTPADASAIDKEWHGLPREYRQGSTLSRAEVCTLLAVRLRDYGAGVLSAAAADVPGVVADLLMRRGRPRVVVPQGLRAGVLPGGFEFVVDAGFTAVELDTFGGVLTESTLAIAETGTIILQNVPGQGRRVVTLMPDFHLCLVDAASVVETVPEAIALLQGTARLATTFISGPSATADIEMVRVEGVHGPRFLAVVLVGG